MNAALATDVPSDTSRQLPHTSVRQLLVAVIILLIALLVAWLTYSQVAGGPTSYAGVADPADAVSLDFNNSAAVAQILVHGGEHVVAGQPLATQSQTAAKTALADAEAVLAANEQNLASLEKPTEAPASAQSQGLQVSQAQSQLAAAQKALNDASTQGTNQVVAAQAVVNQTETLVQQDAAQFATACPTGTAPPAGLAALLAETPTAAAPTTTTTTVAVPNGAVSPIQTTPTVQTTPTTLSPVSPEQLSQYNACLGMQTQDQKDSGTLSQAKSALVLSEAAAQQNKDAAAATVENDQVALQLSQNEGAITTSPASGSTVAMARVGVATAQATVDQDKMALTQLTLVASTAGVVADIGGKPGDLDGQNGVHVYSGPQSSQSNSSVGFSLIPSSPSSETGSNSTVSQQPLITLQGDQLEGLAEVSESRAANLVPGAHAKITINALDRTIDGQVTQVVPIPVRQSGSVDYQVRIAASEWPAHALAGMSLSVTFP